MRTVRFSVTVLIFQFLFISILLLLLYKPVPVNTLLPVSFPFSIPFPLNYLMPSKLKSTSEATESKSESEASSNVRFFLYPFQRARNYSEELKSCSRFSFDKSHFNPHLGLIVITHGFMENYKGFPQRLKNAYLAKRFPANIVLVDWQGAAQPNFGIAPMNLLAGYPLASKFVLTTLGPQISAFLICIIKQGYIAQPSYIHLIGFSLGAQASGIAGSAFKEATGKEIGRITGLDPAGIDYHILPAGKRLSKDDAYFVDVVHTNKGFYGILNAVGDVDFWVNGGGTWQPGCGFPKDPLRDVPGLPASCSHARAWDFFIQSILRPFPRKACSSTSVAAFALKGMGSQSKVCSSPVYFGQYANITAKGNYYLQMRISSKY